VPQDSTDPAGDLVSAVLATGAGGDPISDVDAGAVEGIAVVALDTSNGTWQYSLNGGGSWTTFAPVSEDSARLLASDSSTKVRFVPNPGFNGTVDPGVSFRAWDQTAGSNGDTASTTLNGGTTPFSAAIETAAVTVTAAVSSCARAGSTLEIEIAPGGQLSIGRLGVNFQIGGAGITDPTCGGASVNNVDLVQVNGTSGNETLTIDQTNGQFAPGSSGEGDTAEIEFALDLGSGSDSLTVIGTPGNDVHTLGTAGLNPNSDGDSDWTLAGIELVSVDGGGGRDVISGAGGNGTGLAFPGPLNLGGGSDNDVLTGGAAADVELGGPGNDTFKETNVLGGGDSFVGGTGSDLLNYAARKTSVTVTLDGVANDGGAGENDNAGTDVENVTGGTKGDSITGNQTSGNTFKGGKGVDTLSAQDGISGNDTLVGAAGADTCIADPGDRKRKC
jgi:hypothetical protein